MMQSDQATNLLTNFNANQLTKLIIIIINFYFKSELIIH